MMTSDVSERRLQLHMLFSRLSWPSILVKERSCHSISELLNTTDCGEECYQFLLHWLSNQELESIAVYGLLSVIGAYPNRINSKISIKEIWDAVRRKSLLAWLLISSIDTKFRPPLASSLEHSGRIPDEFISDPYFHRHVKKFLPPIYHYWAQQIEKDFLIPFQREWSYEWSKLLEITETPLEESSLDFWRVRSHNMEDHAHADTKLSEVYRSAFIRTLARAVDEQKMPLDTAVFFVSQACPLDVELWLVQPTPKPAWWPQVDENANIVDTGAAQIWKQVDMLWEQQLALLQQGKRDQWIISKALGSINTISVQFELDIHAVFQRCYGPSEPNLENVFPWLQKSKIIPDFERPLHFMGVLHTNDEPLIAEEFNDWGIISSCVPVMGAASYPWWQYWRFSPDIWVPSPYLFDKSLQFNCSTTMVAFEQNHSLVAKWQEWTSGISERSDPRLPDKAGQIVYIRADKLNAFRNSTRAAFCWLCHLKGYYVKDKFSDKLETFEFFRVLGASNIVQLD